MPCCNRWCPRRRARGHTRFRFRSFRQLEVRQQRPEEVEPHPVRPKVLGTLVVARRRVDAERNPERHVLGFVLGAHIERARLVLVPDLGRITRSKPPDARPIELEIAAAKSDGAPRREGVRPPECTRS
jgi:hypothetical protein